MKSARSACSSDPDWFAMNQVPACWATAARTCSSLGVTTSLHPRHSTPAMSEPLRQVLLHHVRRHVETLADLLVAQAMAILKYDRGSTLGRELPKHRAQARDTLRNVELPIKCRQFAQPLLDARLIKVHAAGPASDPAPRIPSRDCSRRYRDSARDCESPVSSLTRSMRT